MKVEQLRDLFGLDAAEELYGDYSCAHTKPRWGSQFLHGQLYVFSTCMVFHANLIAVVKAVRIYFKDVSVIRKRSFLRMPNTIALTRLDASGTWHEDVFTSFVFASRRRAFNTMVQRWREINPAAAAAHLDQVPLTMRPRGSLTGHRALSAALVDSDSEGADAQPAVEANFPRPFQQLMLSASLADAVLQPPDGVDMKEVARQQLPGDAQQLAEVLLANTSGFLPRGMLNQGNQLVSITPWQVVPEGHCSLPPGSLQRTFRYIFTNNGAWGAVRSVVVQQQVLQLFDDGRLVLSISQRMPELPAGVGKALHVIIQWVAEPVHSRAGAISPQQGITTPRATAPAVSFTSPMPVTSSMAGVEAFAADAVAADGPGQRCSSEPHLCVQRSGPSTPRSLPPAALAEAQPQYLQCLPSTQTSRPAANVSSPFMKVSNMPLGPEPRPGSFMGLAGPAQPTAPEHHLQGCPSDDLPGKRDLQHALLAASCPDLVKGSQQPDHSWSPGQHARPAPAYSMPLGTEDDHPHLAKLNLKKHQLLAGLKGSLKELQSPLIRLKKTSSSHSCASTGSSSKVFGVTWAAGHSESTITGSVLGSVDEEHEVGSPAVSGTARHQSQQQQRHEACVPAACATTECLSRGSRGGGEAGGDVAASLTSLDMPCSNCHDALDSRQHCGQVTCGTDACRADTPLSKTGVDHGRGSDQHPAAAPPWHSSTAGGAQPASESPSAARADDLNDTGSAAQAASMGLHNSHFRSSGSCTNKDSTGCSSSSSSGVVLKVSVGIQWVKWHIAQKKVTDDTLAATKASQEAIMDQALSWLENPSQRQLLAAVMPQAVRSSPGGRKHHRRSGSAGSSGRVATASRTLSATTGAAHRMAGDRHPVTCRPRGGWLQQLMEPCARTLDVVGAGFSRPLSASVQPLTGVVLVLALLVSAGHMLLLWKAIQLLSILLEKLDSQLAPGSTCNRAP